MGQFREAVSRRAAEVAEADFALSDPSSAKAGAVAVAVPVAEETGKES